MLIGIVDLETTDFLEDGGFIVEVGIACLNTESGNIHELYHSICREEGMTKKQRSAWIFENSDLTVEEVRGAPDFSEIKPLVQEALYRMDACTAFNKAFDFGFLRSRGVDVGPEWPCPMEVLTPIMKLPKTGRARFYPGYKWPNVEEAWRYFFPDEPYDEKHRGLDDAMHEARIVYELFKLGEMT